MPRPSLAARPAQDRPVGNPADIAAPETSADDGEGSKTFITALARGLDVIKAFTSQEQHLTLSDISRIVDLPRATTRRCLMTLQTLGYVESNGRYFSLAPMVLTIARAYLTSSVLPRVAQPFLEKLSDQLGESCSLSVLNDTDTIYVARSARKRMASLHREVGFHLPAHCTSMGRVLLAAASEAQLEAFFKKATLTRFTPHTVVDPEKLRAILKEVERDGYCIVEQELEIGLRAIAVPVRNVAGVVVGAINVSAQAGHATRAKMTKELLPMMLQTAADMRSLLVS